MPFPTGDEQKNKINSIFRGSLSHNAIFVSGHFYPFTLPIFHMCYGFLFFVFNVVSVGMNVPVCMCAFVLPYPIFILSLLFRCLFVLREGLKSEQHAAFCACASVLASWPTMHWLAMAYLFLS